MKPINRPHVSIRANRATYRFVVPSTSRSALLDLSRSELVRRHVGDIDTVDLLTLKADETRISRDGQVLRLRSATNPKGSEARSGVEVRTVPFAAGKSARAATSTTGQTLEGVAAVFNDWTMINDRQGAFRERVAPGAFTRSLRERPHVAMQYDHGQHPLIGSLPLGRYESLVEDGVGLRVRGRLTDNWLIQPVRDAIRDGAVTGMSFKFTVVADRWERDKDGTELRTLLDVDVHECGPVHAPAYFSTSVGVS